MADPLQEGALVKGFRIIRMLGRGSYGLTYLAQDERLGREVALKEFCPAVTGIRRASGGGLIADDDEGRQWLTAGIPKFLQEAQTLVRCPHPNVVHVYGYFDTGNTAYMVMQYEQGRSLEAELQERGTIPEAELLNRLVLPLLDGLERVHGEGLIHRDIKPANIFIRGGDGSPVLLDFGSARESGARTLTAQYTPDYAPPEQHTQGREGPFTDIYALGTVIYRALAGELPVNCLKRMEALYKGSSDPLQPLSRLATDNCSPALETVVHSALSLDEKARPQSVVELRNLLKVAMAAQASPAGDSGKTGLRLPEAPVEPAPGPFPAPGRRIHPAVWALSLAVLFGGGGYWFARMQDGVGGPVSAGQTGGLPIPVAPLPDTPHPLPEAPLPGAVFITSTPAGAFVYLDGVRQGGVTPLEMTGLKPGVHRLRLESGACGKLEEEVRVEGGVRTEVERAIPGADDVEYAGVCRSRGEVARLEGEAQVRARQAREREAEERARLAREQRIASLTGEIEGLLRERRWEAAAGKVSALEGLQPGAGRVDGYRRQIEVGQRGARIGELYARGLEQVGENYLMSPGGNNAYETAEALGKLSPEKADLLRVAVVEGYLGLMGDRIEGGRSRGEAEGYGEKALRAAEGVSAASEVILNARAGYVRELEGAVGRGDNDGARRALWGLLALGGDGGRYGAWLEKAEELEGVISVGRDQARAEGLLGDLAGLEGVFSGSKSGRLGWYQERVAGMVVAPPGQSCFPGSEPVSGATPLTCREKRAGMEFVWIPGGEYWMGSPDGTQDVDRDGDGVRDAKEADREGDEGPVHKVRLSGFWMGKYEVTQGQWKKLLGDGVKPHFTNCGGECPMESVSWNQTQDFIAALNRDARGGRYRLPSEAQWEYGCRAGTYTPFHTGGTINADSQANYDGNYPYGGGPKGRYRESPVSVGSFPANVWGLHDMHGNVWEWVEDWYDSGYYGKGEAGGPDPASNNRANGNRVLRGGSWVNSAWRLRCANRNGDGPVFRSFNIGFRLVFLPQD